ncbi:MAG: MerR family DNA-binding transcriptional regulator [Candidatus Phaeomarinobacter sp.]
MDQHTASTATDNRNGAPQLPPHAARPGEPGHDANGPTFSITQLAEEFDVTTRAIRLYEDKDLLHPAREGQTRVKSTRDRARLQLIQRGKRVGFTLSEIREIIDLYDLRDGLTKQLEHARGKYVAQIEKLEAQRKDIDESISLLRHGIDFVDGELAQRSDTANGQGNGQNGTSHTNQTAQA